MFGLVSIFVLPLLGFQLEIIEILRRGFWGLRSMEFQFLEVYCCYSEEVKHYCFHKVSQWSPSTFSERHEGHNGWLALRETHFDEGD